MGDRIFGQNAEPHQDLTSPRMVEQKGLKPVGEDSLASMDGSAEVSEKDYKQGQLMKGGQGEAREEDDDQ